jgi:hypothetical protein
VIAATQVAKLLSALSKEDWHDLDSSRKLNVNLAGLQSSMSVQTLKLKLQRWFKRKLARQPTLSWNRTVHVLHLAGRGTLCEL